MKRHKFKVIVFFFILVFVVSFIVYSYFNRERELVVNIEDILQTEYYSYLPEEAKDVIREVYENDGVVLRTEKNKGDHELYLNPLYVDYLLLDDAEKEQVEVIPDEYIIDYIPNDRVDGDTFESTFRLDQYDSNHDGEPDMNFTSPLKNQKSLGLCWDYTTIEDAETYLMYSKKETYEAGVTPLFSTRQLDYATSINGIRNVTHNFYGSRSLGSGGTFSLAIKPMLVGESLFAKDWPYDTSYSYDMLDYHEVFDNRLSLYEVTASVEMPILSYNSHIEHTAAETLAAETFINNMKYTIKQYGGAYVGTYAPGYQCSAPNVLDPKNTAVIDVDTTCTRNGSHAMQIIGWDDDYEYKYCINGERHTKWTSSCSEANTVTGKGVWILRNSWGETSTYKYVYLAYYSLSSNISFISGMESRQTRLYDTFYHSDLKNLVFSSRKTYREDGNTYISVPFQAVVDEGSSAKAIKLKFRNGKQDSNFKIYFSPDGNDSNFQLISEVFISFPGYTTIDLSSKNLTITNQSKFKIDSINGASLSNSTFYLFTREMGDHISIHTDDVVYSEEVDLLENGKYNVYVPSDTYHIPSGVSLEYELYDQFGYRLDDFSYTNPIVSSGHVMTQLHLPAIGDHDFYTLKIFYQNTLYSTSKLILADTPCDGSGTIDDPYIINTPFDLASIRYHNGKAFALGQDIDLTYDTQDPNGKFYNGGKGWLPIGSEEQNAFYGVLDGRGHKIIGLKISSSNSLFYRIDSNNGDTVIKNLVFEDTIASSTSLFAPLIYARNNHPVLIENISVIGGSFTSSRFISGTNYSYFENGLTIRNIFVNTTFKTCPYSFSSMNYVNDNDSSKASMLIENIEVLGNYSYSASNTGSLVSTTTGNVLYRNILVHLSNGNHPIILFKTFNKSSKGYTGKIQNLVYTSNNNTITVNRTTNPIHTEINTSLIDLGTMTDSTTYSSWTNFSQNWNLETIDGVPRIPILKNGVFEYIKIAPIKIKKGETIHLLDYVTPSVTLNSLYTENTDILELQGFDIHGVEVGTGNLIVSSEYDGFSKIIPVEVVSNDQPILRFNGNNATSGIMGDLSTSSTTIPESLYSRTGYVFVGWNTKADGSGDPYQVGETITLIDDVTLYAQWRIISYKILFHYNLPEDQYITVNAQYNEMISLPVGDEIPHGTYYSFKEWNSRDDGTGISYKDSVVNLTMEDGNIVNIYAIWSSSGPTVSYNKNGGTGKMNLSIAGLDGKVKIRENEFEKEGYTFTGWNTLPTGDGTPYTAGDVVPITSDVYLYAQWEKSRVTISFRPNGGVGDMPNQSILSAQSVQLNQNAYTCLGHIFLGWNTQSDGLGVPYSDMDTVSPSEDLILYAIWRPIQYTIRFKRNGGSGVMQDITLKYNQSTALPTVQFARFRYEFVQWNTQPDGEGEAYQNQQIINSLTTQDGDVITLYAIWIRDSSWFDINTYNLDDNNLFLDEISPNTTVEQYLSHFSYDDDYTVTIDLGTRTQIYTGSVVHIHHNGEEVAQYTNIVKGDSNGDGKIDSADLLRVRQKLLNIRGLDGAYFTAADINRDNKIDSADLLRIRQHLLKIRVIS